MLSLLLKNTKVTPYKLYHIIHDDSTNPVSADLYCDLDLHIKQLNSGATSFFQWLKGNLDKVNIHYIVVFSYNHTINCEIHSKNQIKVMCCTSSNLRPENVKLEERTNSLGIAYNHAYSLLRAQGII